MVHRWLSNDHVAEWYPIANVRRPPPDLVRRHYLPRLRGEEPGWLFAITLNNRPVGLIQTYFVRDFPNYAAAVQVEDGAAGVDLFIGEEDAVHRGLGSLILRRFLREIVFGEMGAAVCVIGPRPENRIAIRAYDKAGFRYLKTVHVPGEEGGLEYLMRIMRDDSG
jgi:aminoglycoside 6'-N-acetyltransferase